MMVWMCSFMNKVPSTLVCLGESQFSACVPAVFYSTPFHSEKCPALDDKSLVPLFTGGIFNNN